MTCSVCKKGYAKTPAPCEKCGQPTCEKCRVDTITPAEWEIRTMPSDTRRGRRPWRNRATFEVCKNCVAERVLTED